MSLKALAVGGHVSLIGASLTPPGTGLDPLLLIGRGITLGSISVGSRTDFEAMNRAIAMHRLRPVIDRTFPFAPGEGSLPPFPGSRPFRQGRDHARLKSPIPFLRICHWRRLSAKLELPDPLGRDM